ncbi:hypothetical protein LTR78_009840 [Recurvomyces mirabilis]|uniref:Uncharacterized protein n=1 Tax=Recurvomyces mirabilis TaxID=574656 RepID=A0AAE0TQW7_9PEZI|nr:hypothetical protein LTR78_009840 [Recurvomyces mirabilis]KAK5153076.1 hypothetical protein LTS14_007720 [Recurvomyces mirabilis]
MAYNGVFIPSVARHIAKQQTCFEQAARSLRMWATRDATQGPQDSREPQGKRWLSRYTTTSDSNSMPEMSRASLIPHGENCQQGTSTSIELSHAALRPLLKAERHKSVSQRMLSKVKQGINNRSKASLSVRAVEAEPSLIRRLSARRKHSSDNERRAQSFEISRDSVRSIDECDFEGLSREASMAGRSLSDYTLATSELMVDCPSTPTQHHNHNPLAQTPYTSDTSSPQHVFAEASEQTPRPMSSKLPMTAKTRIIVPSVSVAITLEQATVDCNLRADVWVAIEASVQAFNDSSSVSGSGVHSKIPHNDLNVSDSVAGRISSLRLCYKPVQGCTILDVIGHKSMKDLKIGQKCSLFVKVRVYEAVPRESPMDHDDQNSLFTELESLVGTLTTDLLHVEVRYRTSLLPYDNVVTVKSVAKVARPQTESRWSVIETYSDIEMSEQTHTKLAIYIADTYPAERALEYLDRHLANELEREEPLQQMRRLIAAEINENGTGHNEVVVEICPMVVVTADESKSSMSERPATALSSGSHGSGRKGHSRYSNTGSDSRTVSSSAMPSPLLHVHPPLQTSQSPILMTATRIDSPSPKNDDARRVWHHIRRSSRSTNLLASKGEDQIEDLEASDERLKSLRDKALANKRSIGAETLKGWKWDGEVMKLGEAPWL